MDNNNQSSPSPPADLSLFLTLLKHFASSPARQLAPLARLGSLAGGPLGLASQLPLLESSVYGDAPATDKIMGKQSAGNTPTARVGKAFDTFRYYPEAPMASTVGTAPQDAVVPQVPQDATALPIRATPLPWWLEHVGAGLGAALSQRPWPDNLAFPEQRGQSQQASADYSQPSQSQSPSSIIEQFIRMFMDSAKKEGGPYTPSGVGGPDFQNGSRG